MSKNLFPLLSLLFLVLLIGCRSPKKKANMTGDEKVVASDFFDFFSEKALPFTIGDSLLQSKDNDSLRINKKVFSQFVPDTAISAIFSKSDNLKIYPVGKLVNAEKETFLIIKGKSGEKKQIAVFAFNKENKFVAALSGLQNATEAGISRSFVIDRKYAFSKNAEKKNKDGSISEGKEVYALDAVAGKFMLIMTDPLSDKITVLVNPIDTLPRTHKLAADYTNGKMNLVSIRDGRKPGTLQIFIHFDKNEGQCNGEIKGDAVLIKPNVAEFHESGDPCVLQLEFSSSSVTLNEIEGCGSRRPLDCTLNGSYQKVKKVTAKKKK